MNMNIAIVSMVKHSKSKTNVGVTNECPTTASVVSLKLNESLIQTTSMDIDVSRVDYSLNIVCKLSI